MLDGTLKSIHMIRDSGGEKDIPEWWKMRKCILMLVVEGNGNAERASPINSEIAAGTNG